MSAEILPQFTSLENCQPVQLHNYPGIYFLCQGATIVYIGRSKNVAKRIVAHSREAEKEFDTVMVMHVPEESLTSVEMHWIRRLRPKYNDFPGRRKTGKITITLRVFPTTKRLLAKAARLAKRQISDYAEEALLERVRKDEIK